MASYYSALEAARVSLGLGAELRELLMVVAKNPNAELTQLFASLGIDATAQIPQLQAIVQAATPAEPEPAPEPEPEPVVVQEVVEVVVEEVQEDEDDDVDLDEDDEPAEETPEPEALPEVAAGFTQTAAVAEDTEGLDASEYLLVDVASTHPVESLKVTTNDAGLFEASWPAAEDAVFVVVAGEKRFPDSIESATEELEVLAPTRKNSKTFESKYRYISVFRFDEPGQPGYKIGQGRALGRLLKFEADKYPGRVILTWSTDDPEATVVIFKSEPNKKLEKVPTSEPEHKPADSFWNDLEVKVGQSFEYRAHLEWRLNALAPVDTTEKDAITVGVVVPGPVPRIDDFWVQRNPGENEVTVRFPNIVKEGVVLELYQKGGDPGNSLVARGNTQFTLDEFKDKQFASQIGSKVNQEPEIIDGVRTYKGVPLLRDADNVTESTITYTAVSRLGNDVFITKPFVLQIVDDLEVLGLEDFYDYHLMRLEVPTGATSFQVWVTDLDRKFEDVADMNPTRVYDRQTHYDLFGGIRFENDELTATPRKIFVRGTSAFFDGQSNAGQHREFIYPGRVTVRYRVVKPPQQAAAKGGLFGKKQPATSAPIQQKIELAVDYPQFGVTNTGEQIALMQLELQQLKALEPAFPLMKRDQTSAHFKALATLDLSQFSQSGVFREVLDRQGQPLELDQPGRNRFVAYFIKEMNIATKVFVINHDDDMAMNGNGRDEPGRPDAIPNAERKLKIAIVGGKASGKTTYLAALLQYLRHQFAPSFGSRLEPKPGDAKAQARAEQLNNFVRSGSPLPPTDSAYGFTDVAVGTDVTDPRTRFSFKTLVSAGSPVGEFEFLDLAGEDLATPEALSLYAEGLQEADLIVFLFDPLQLPVVRNILKGKMEMPPENAADPAVIWSNLIQVLGPVNARKNPNQKVAIAISKFDAITSAMESGHFSFFETFDSAMSIIRDPYATNPNPPSPNARRDFNWNDGGDVHSETKALLRLIGLTVEADLDQDATGWPIHQVKYFVVSALGQGIKGRAHGLSSFRIGDPIRWALANPR